MGDEVHNRNRAATSLLYRALAPAVVTTCAEPSVAAEVLEFINHNDHFFLNLSMAGLQGDAGRRARDQEQQHRGRHGAQRHGFRRAAFGHGQPMVHRPG